MLSYFNQNLIQNPENVKYDVSLTLLWTVSIAGNYNFNLQSVCNVSASVSTPPPPKTNPPPKKVTP